MVCPRHKRIESKDRLSNLSQNILDRILVCLPIRDSVRTCILSKKWRYAWSTIPELTFDKECRLALKDETTSSHLVSIVDHVLLLHNGPIRRFQISGYLHSYNAHVDKWILHLTRKGIEELYLNFDEEPWNGYTMSSCLFSYIELKVLSLNSYVLTVPPTFDGFFCLTTVKLDIIFLDEHTVSCLVSRCPLLEILKLKFTNEMSCFKIHAAKLKSLSVLGEFMDVVLAGCPQLVDVDIGCHIASGFVPNTCNLEKVLGCLSLIERLCIDFYCLQFLALGPVSYRLFHSLQYLKFLFINVNFEDSKEISAALCIFRSSPRLETIQIMDNSDDDLLQSNDSFDWNSADCVFYQLKKLEIISLIGRRHAMEFVKLVLANAPALEIMSVRVDNEAKTDEY